MAVPVVATQDVIRAVRDADRYRMRSLGAQPVRGKREPVEVYAIEEVPTSRRVPTVRSAPAAAHHSSL
jgi:class 3 adenylate cyclase